MSTAEPGKVGSIVWRDLTVPDAEGTRQFYEQVVGWTSVPVEMGGYSDYCMNDANEDTVAGICHARGPNVHMPSQWLMYITVADAAASAKRCAELGGQVLDGPRPMDGRMFCVIRDPAGAVAALIEP